MYQSINQNPFQQSQSPDQNVSDHEDEETPHNIKFTIPQNTNEKGELRNLLIHVARKKLRLSNVMKINETQAQWNHVVDLDKFFQRIYKYHQHGGFKVILLQKLLELVQIILLVVFIVFAAHCVNYPVLFRDKLPSRDDPKLKNLTKVTINDVLYSSSQCYDNFDTWTYSLVIIGSIFWIFRAITSFFQIIHNWDIKSFFNVALKIEDIELENYTWHEVQRRIRQAQSEMQLCIHKENLTELDIYHRILRFKNYSVAMINKSVLPSKLCIPIIGDVNVLSKLLILNIEFILFRGPFACFENSWHLKPEFKRQTKRNELAAQLSRHIMWFALLNLIFAPIVFLWQVLFFFFSYAAIMKKEPNFLGTRIWSQYGKLYLRHFNELDHELEARLNRAYRPAVRYMDSFSSPLVTVFAKFGVFLFGALGTFILILTVFDEDVIQVEHVLTIMTVSVAVSVTCASLLPDENLVFCPEQLMKNILCHAHYLKPEWRGFAHTSKVYVEFEDFFQLKAFYFLNEICSPFLTFFVLMFSLRPRSLEIVDFFRNFTVSVVGVGDVCSFAQMEIRKHGNPDWQITNSAEEITPLVETNQYTQGENGKTELSLIHFALTNPNWKMSEEAEQFLRGLHKHAIQDIDKTRTNIVTGLGNIGTTAMGQSLGSLTEEYPSVVQSVLQIQNLSTSQNLSMSMYQSPNYKLPTQHIPVTPPNTAHIQAQSTTTPTFDFERILHQNLTDGSMPGLRSQFLPNINEDDDDDHEYSSRQMPSVQPVPSNKSAIGMNMSVRGSLSKREGPVEASRNGLLYSLCNIPQSETVFSPEFTAADMCLSTLYLHELHFKQQVRRGVRLQASQKHLWQRPHQNQPEQPSTAERTPLISKT